MLIMDKYIRHLPEKITYVVHEESRVKKGSRAKEWSYLKLRWRKLRQNYAGHFLKLNSCGFNLYHHGTMSDPIRKG